MTSLGELAGPLSEDWAWGGSDGRGVVVAVVDSGVDASHPMVGALDRAVAVQVTDEKAQTSEVVDDEVGDVAGHGTACAAMVRSVAPGTTLWSVRVLGDGLTGKGWAVADGLEWTLDAGAKVVNLSLSTPNELLDRRFRRLCDRAARDGVLVVAALSNERRATIPAEFTSVLSVAAVAGVAPGTVMYQGAQAEWGAPGVDVEVAWSGGSTIRATGNSFAAPVVAGLVARIVSKHPELRPFEVRTVLRALAGA